MRNSQKNSNKILPTVMTIAGSDGCCGAGGQADLRTFNAFGVNGCFVVSAITSQNFSEVRRIDVMSDISVKTQIETLFAELPITVIKTGMLANSAIVSIVSDICKKNIVKVVVDPVMLSTSGKQLLDDTGIKEIQDNLLFNANWITPNIPEAELLTNIKINNLDDIVEAGEFIVNKWDINCIIKGGHSECFKDKRVDVVFLKNTENSTYLLSSPKVENDCIGHGTGCVFASALASGIALNYSLEKILIEAKAFIYGSLVESALIAENLQIMHPPKKDYKKDISLNIK